MNEVHKLISDKELYSDFISFIDEDDKKKEWYVKIIDMGYFLKFKTKDGNIISIPSSKVLKIKQKGESDE